MLKNYFLTFVTRRAGSQSSRVSSARLTAAILGSLGWLVLPALAGAASMTITFENFALGDPPNDGSVEYNSTGTHYRNGSEKAVPAAPWQSGSANLANEYDTQFQSYAGWALSNTTDNVNGGWGNQWSAMAGGGYNSATYGIFYESTFAPTSPDMSFTQLLDLGQGGGAFVTNNAYGYFDMLNGSGFSKKFGGATGNDPDFLRITFQGLRNGQVTADVDFYLADFRSANNSLDYILDDWTWVDLSALGVVDSLEIFFTSSDNGQFGINTPTYVAVDDFTGTLIPEPGSAALVLLGGGLALLMRRRRQSFA